MDALKAILLQEINDTRTEKNITQAEIADAIGIYQPNVSNMLSGRTKPRLGTLIAMAKAVGIPVEIKIDGDIVFE